MPYQVLGRSAGASIPNLYLIEASRDFAQIATMSTFQKHPVGLPPPIALSSYFNAFYSMITW